MRYHLFAGAMTALGLVGSTGAQAQVLIQQPAMVAPGPAYVVSPYAAPMVVAPAPGYVPVAPPAAYVTPGYGYSYGYSYAQPYVSAPIVADDGYTTVNSYTGRRCTVKPDGYRWCWTP